MTFSAAIADLFKSVYEAIGAVIGLVYGLVHGAVMAVVHVFEAVFSFVGDVFSGAFALASGAGKFVFGNAFVLAAVAVGAVLYFWYGQPAQRQGQGRVASAKAQAEGVRSSATTRAKKELK